LKKSPQKEEEEELMMMMMMMMVSSEMRSVPNLKRKIVRSIIKLTKS